MLQRLGLISSWSDRQIGAGQDWAKALDAHLETASLILLLVSSDFLASNYCYGIEMKRALERHQAKEAQVIPILVRPVDWHGAPFEHLQALPTGARPIMMWPNQDEAFADIAAGIRRAIEDFPALSASAPHSASPSVWNIPYPRNPVFTGREKILTDLASVLKTSQATALSQARAISGLGGIGKTQVAIEYAYQHRQDYQAVFWTRADTRESLCSGYVAIAELLDLPVKDEQNQTIMMKAVVHWLTTNTGWLLILDNADDLALVREFLPTVFDGHLLLTTRAQSMGRLAKRIEVETMNQDVGALFLLRRVGLVAENASLGTGSSSDIVRAREICEELGGLPLALDQAGAFIEEAECSLTDYLSLYRMRRAEMLKERGGLVDDHPEPVATTWSLSFVKIEEKNPAAADLLRFCAFLHPDAIPEEIITRGASHLGFHLQEAVSDPLSLNRAIAALGAYSLVRRDTGEKTLSVHRLVQAVLKDTMDEQTRHVWSERTVQAVNEVFPEVEFTNWPKCERYLSHALVCAELVQQKQINSPEAANVLQRAGWYLTDRARYSEAQRLLERAYQISQEVRGETHLETARDAHTLARLYQVQGKYSEAEALYQRALSIYEQSLGPEHPDTGTTLYQLAYLYQDQEKYREAEALLKRALAIDEQALGAEHPNTAATQHALAYLYQEQGKYSEAEPLYQPVLAIKVSSIGSEHPDTATTLHELARLYQAEGKYSEAEELYQRALAIRERVLGADHPQTKAVHKSYASLLQEMGREMPDGDAASPS